MRAKPEYKIVGLAILFLLCWMGYSPLASRCAAGWSDDFNDGDYDGWTIFENESNWTATNNYLQIDQGSEGGISHPSTVAYGTWSFDVKADEDSFDGFAVDFISNDVNEVGTDHWNCYWLSFGEAIQPEGKAAAISLRYYNYSTGAVTIDSAEDPIPLAGWLHIEVTRTTAGLFSVYHNGSLIMQGAHTEMETSELFMFWGYHQEMFDNFIVSDAPPIDSMLIVIIGVSAVVIIAVVAIFLKRR
ncbi:MAG: hypothetical protein ACFFCP_17280 [Promethearchaeota archaeon]